MERFLAGVAALSGLAAVIADASAQHLLAGDPARASLAATGARDGLVHAAALLGLAALLRHAEATRRAFLLGAAWCFTAALLFFPPTLYFQAAALLPGLLPLVPLGGTLFIAGWAALAIAAFIPPPPR